VDGGFVRQTGTTGKNRSIGLRFAENLRSFGFAWRRHFIFLVAIRSRLEFFLHADRVLGLDLAIDIGRRSSIEVPTEVAALAEQRAAARAAKDWAESDRLRDAIADLGWTVTDSKDGQQLQQ
jgi:hypothetical protein